MSNDFVTEILFYLESYPGAGRLVIPAAPVTFTSKLRLQDQKQRKLFLNALVTVQKGAEVQVKGHLQFVGMIQLHLQLTKLVCKM